MRRRFACVRGNERVDCGPAALATVARHHGLHVTVARLRELMGTDAQGTELDQIRSAAAEIGFDVSSGRALEDALDGMPLPAIVHLADPPEGHFVVLHQVDAKSVVVADPKRGVERWDREAFEKRWTRNVVLLAPSDDFRPSGREASALSRIAGLAWSERGLLLRSVACAVVMTALGFSAAFYVKEVLDRVIPQRDLGLLGTLGIAVLAALLFRGLCEIGRHFALARVGNRIERKLVREYFLHLVSLPVRFFDGRVSGDLTSRLGDASSVRAAVTGPIALVLVDLMLLAACVAVMLVYNPVLTLTTLAVLPMMAAVTIALQRPLLRLQREMRGMYGVVLNRFMETVANIRVIKAFAAESAASDRFEKQFTEMQQIQWRTEILSGLSSASTVFLSTAASVVLLWIGAQRVIGGGISIGELMLFSSLLGFLMGPAQSVAMSVTLVRQAAVGMERLTEIGAARPEEEASADKLSPPSLRGEVEVSAVSFAYRSGYPVLLGVDFRVTPGETVVLMGETGSGKTSIAGLISGFYEADEGRVLIDGVEIRRYDLRGLRKKMGIVFQDPTLMSGTVRDNIALGDPEASLDRVREAARVAGADEFISALPKQYDYEVGERGVALSSGQRQRIAIARALLRDPEILLLDEATSHLDVETEARVMEAVLERRRGRTTVIITHRLSIARRADRILLLDRGRIVEQGSHEALLARGGMYESLWTRSGATTTSSGVR